MEVWTRKTLKGLSLVHDPVLVNSLPANRKGLSESIGLNI